MRPEDAMQALSPLGYPLPLSASTGPDRKLSKALSKPVRWDFLAGLGGPGPMLQEVRFQQRLWAGSHHRACSAEYT